MFIDALLEVPLTSKSSFSEAVENAVRHFRERARTTDERLFAQAFVQTERGAQRLDQKNPQGWVQFIGRATIRISDQNNCILAVIYGSYADGLRALGITDTRAHLFGFRVQLRVRPNDIRVHSSDYYYRRAWVTHIAMRS
jgi:hypothetical protein